MGHDYDIDIGVYAASDRSIMSLKQRINKWQGGASRPSQLGVSLNDGTHDSVRLRSWGSGQMSVHLDVAFIVDTESIKLAPCVFGYVIISCYQAPRADRMLTKVYGAD